MSKRQIQNAIRWAGAVIVCVILLAALDQAVEVDLILAIIDWMP